MRLLFYAPGYFGPDAGGVTGGKVSVELMCRTLARRGHSVAILGKLAAPTADGSRVATLTDAEHVVIATTDPTAALAPLLASAAPDAVVFTSAPGLAGPIAACRAARVPIVFNFVLPEFGSLDLGFANEPQFLYLAESRFTARRLAAWFGIVAHAVPPVIERPEATDAHARDRVLFINPVPQKGWAIEQIAHELRDTAFIVLESWSVTEAWRQHCMRRVGGFGNVDWRSTTDDMEPVWARARVLLVPSICEEGWGRVASEAQAHGIPVVASNRGALPEVVGPGGIIVDVHAPIAEWAGAVRRLMADPWHYAAVVEAVRMHAARPEVQPDAVANRFLRLVGEHVERYRQGIRS